MRGWKTILFGGWALASAVLGVHAPAARAEAFKDARLGYSFAYPDRWTVVPVDAGGWLAARFNSNREYDLTDTKENRRVHHRPYLEVVVIPFPPKEDKGVKAARTAPWKDLKEYLDKTCQDRKVGACRLSGEDETTVNGLKVRRLEITVDNPVEGDRRIYGWEFAGDDCFYGLVSEVLVQEEKHLKPDLFQSFSTFRTFQRTGSLPGSEKSGGDAAAGGDRKKDAEREISPEELKKKRDEATGRALSRIKENLQQGWSVTDGRNFIAVSHCDVKYTKEVLSHCECLRAWLEKELGFVGSGYAGKVIVRIFADRQEHDSFLRTRVWTADAFEATTCKDRDGWSDWTFNTLNGMIYWIWMRDKNEPLLTALPQWVEYGLSSYVNSARSRNGVIEFKATTRDSVEMKNLRRSDDITSPKAFFTTVSEALWAQKWAGVQTQFFMDFLISGEASRNPRYRNVLSDYIKNIIFLVDSAQAPNPADERQPQSAKEEEDMRTARRNAWRAKERDTLPRLMEKTFPGWTNKDWDAFDSLYRQDLK
jgi:hypothetical protein